MPHLVVPHFRRRKVSSTRAPPAAGLAVFVSMAAWLSAVPCAASEPLNVGSKRFTESYIVAEIVTRTAAATGPARHLPGLGNTAIVHAALRQGAIDVYPEYLGTIAAELLKLPPSASADIDALNRLLAGQGLGVAVPLGFANGYALAARGTDTNGPRTLSALAAAPALRLGLSHEFIGRADGWPSLRRHYALPQQPTALDHGLAYTALRDTTVDVIDVYTTDAQIGRLGLRVLADDRGFFPRYDAVLLYRLDLPARHPRAWQAIATLAGRIDERTMRSLNARAEIDRVPYAQVAAGFLAGGGGQSGGTQSVDTQAASAQDAGAQAPGARGADSQATGVAKDPPGTRFVDRLFGDDFVRLAGEHLGLVLGSVALAVLLGVPLGVAAAGRPRLRQTVLSVAGVAQTIPSLALLAMLIPLVGRIGTVPALIALVTYALLPIVRNTCVGLAGVPEGLRQAALAVGLTPRQRLRSVELPVAAPVILAGIKTAAVVSVGTATIAAFIGAGGFGERISIGLALNDHAMLMAGALPAAALALLTQWLFDGVEAWWLRRRR